MKPLNIQVTNYIKQFNILCITYHRFDYTNIYLTTCLVLMYLITKQFIGHWFFILLLFPYILPIWFHT